MNSGQPDTRAADEARATGGRRHATLLALGSATVLSIYSAGFIRTRAAANRIASLSEARRPASSAAPESAVQGAPASVAPVESIVVAQTPAGAAHAATPAAAPKPVAPSAVAPAAAPPAETVAATAVASLPAAPAPAPPVVAPVDTPATAKADTARAGWKDGTYAGWGSSRHGDIEATVEIKGGRIVSAIITDCRTRYSCSRIATLPPQVVQRQSAEVDYVSGATQSSDAFYFGVLEALKKAK